jgi:hypothetical protein
MRPTRIAAWLLAPLLIASPPRSPAQEPASAGEAADGYPTRYTTAQVQADFALFRRALIEGHAGLYVFRTPEEIDAVFAEAERRLQSGAAETDLLRVLLWVVAEIRDGHTRALPSQAYDAWREGRPTYFPFSLSWVDGRAWLDADYTAEPGRWAGSELLGLDGRPIAEVAAELLRYTPGDGNAMTGRYHRLQRIAYFGELYQLLFGPVTSFRATLRPPGSPDTLAVELPAIERANLDERRQDRYAAEVEQPVVLTFLDAPAATATRRISRFWGAGVRSGIDAAFRSISEHGIEHLVIDLRQNGGGDEALGQRLIAYLVDRPVRLYERGVVNTRELDWSRYTDEPEFRLGAGDAQPAADGSLQLTAAYYSSLAPQPPLEPRFDGGVYTLIDGGSFSTTSDTCVSLRELGRAVFVGEETGGGYSGNTSGITPTLTLPYTKLRVRVPLVRFFNVTRGEQPLDRGVLPDHRVLPDPSRPERDPALEFALERIRGAVGD